MAKTNEAFAKQLQAVIENIQAVPGQIKDNSDQQYSAFLKELEKMMDARLAQMPKSPMLFYMLFGRLFIKLSFRKKQQFYLNVAALVD